MKELGVWKLLFKLAMLGLPFLVLFILVSLPTPFVNYINRARMQDKVQQLVLNASTTPRVLIDGDSRALGNVIPSVFTEVSGDSAVNIAVGATTLMDAYSILQTNRLFTQKPLVIMSVSFYDINDAQFDVQHDDLAVIHAEPWSAQKIKDLLRYYKAFVGYYVIHFKNVLHFTAGDNIHMSRAEIATGGYTAPSASADFKNSDFSAFPNANWYADARANGVHRAEFIESLQQLGKSGASVVIYIGPTAPFWSGSREDPSIKTADAAFANLIQTTISPYPNIHFINFEAEPIPALTDKEFVDRLHLSQTGGTIFTKELAHKLQADKVLPKQDQ